MATEQLNLRIDPSQKEAIETLAEIHGLKVGSVGSALLKDRFDLLTSGWKFADVEVKQVLTLICALDHESFQGVRDELRKSFPQSEAWKVKVKI